MLKTHQISIINCPESVRSVLPSLLSDLSQPVVFDSVKTIVPFAPINLIFDSLSDAVSALETLSALRIMGKPLRLKPSFDPISMDLGIYYPSNPALLYKYPNPTPEILLNISTAIKAVPALYTQVLHLMNKMHLPPPWTCYPSINDLPNKQDICSKTKATSNKNTMSDSSKKRKIQNSSLVENSNAFKEEFESDSSDTFPIVLESATCKRQKLNSKCGSDGIKSSSYKSVVASKKLNQHAINICIHSQTCDDIALVSNHSTVQPIHPIDTNLSTTETGPSNVELDALSVLGSDRLLKASYSTLLQLPAYKNYNQGSPSKTLFIKNINYKRVSDSQLLNLFSKILPSSSLPENRIDVRLMKKGKMKGQAFVKYETTKLAETALNLFHGLILEEKPMVIQFGKE
ncbi:hypothetical protein QVD99_006142 [Batrachochytrium dendrobatidis]|nr:hypothetical protein O5D80_003867 [Batrachochytrium dendrobatidis]KAK5666920.1 hypothetical protein QVD99_006142 [Batrachochytrium dendrobatidis]